MSPAQKDAALVADCLALVAPAEAAFRSRWRLGTLQRIDPDLHQLLLEQIDLYDVALLTVSDHREVRKQSEAMVRGWRAACARLEAPLQPDDAYLVGYDPHKGLRVVISDQAASVARVQNSKPGERVMIVTPDEVARMMTAWSIVADTKALFPNAEVVSVTPA